MIAQGPEVLVVIGPGRDTEVSQEVLPGGLGVRAIRAGVECCQAFFSSSLQGKLVCLSQASSYRLG